MFINMGAKIKAYRLKREITQDALAQYLNVNCKDVVKWESGEGYPPIELIPVLASYFGVSTDELMCMDEFDNEDKIKEYTDGFQEKVSSGNIKEALDIIREGVMYFPDEFRLKCLLMYGLYLSCDRPAMVKHYSGELLSIGEEILGNCTDDAIRLEAKRLLCLHYYEDLRDTDSAREIAMSLPGRKICREDMLPIISEGESKLTAIKENISSYTSLLINAIMEYVSNNAELKAKDRLELCRTARQIREMVYPDGDIFEGAYTHMMLLKDIAVLLMALEQHDEALDCLYDCAKCAYDFDSLPKTSLHTSALVKGTRFSKTQLQIPQKHKKTPLRDIFLNEIMPLQSFEPVKYSPRITDICGIFNEKEQN